MLKQIHIPHTNPAYIILYYIKLAVASEFVRVVLLGLIFGFRSMLYN